MRPHLRLRANAAPGGEQGSALLLVLLLVPALMLIGAAFLSTALREGERALVEEQTAQSLYYAEGGVARATWALISQGRLENVSLCMPAGVLACSAQQSGLTSGDVNWLGADITITVSGTSGPFQRHVQTLNHPSGQKLNLKHVITTPGLVSIQSPNPPSVSSTLNGPVVTGDASTDLSSVLGTHPVTVTSVPQLDVQTACNQLLAGYSETVVTGATLTNSSHDSPYLFDGSSGTHVYFSNDPGLWVGTTGSAGCINVKGEVLWVIEGGAQFGKDFEFLPVAGTNARLLVLITKNTSNGKSLEMQKVIFGSDLPIVVVTDGSFNFAKDCTFLNIAMYGSSLSAAKGENFAYDAAVMDPIIESFDARDLLPCISNAQSGTLAAVAGGWVETP